MTPHIINLAKMQEIHFIMFTALLSQAAKILTDARLPAATLTGRACAQT
jgi:hypothetical protein